MRKFMENQSLFFFFCLLALALPAVLGAEGVKPTQYNNFTRSNFPEDFIFGAGSSAYQIEGAALEDGKGKSVWDTYVRKYSERIVDGSTGDEAADFYHKYKEDIKLMKKIGLESFRFSISWSRVLPKGRVSGGVNKLGVNFYNNLIDELIANGITPFATLLHFDHPQALEDEYGAFGSRKFIDDFAEYADFAFKTFGDRVKHWVTMNEPNAWITFIFQADAAWSGQGGSTTSGPYVMGHNLILAHGAAAKIYKEKYQAIQNGKIGITIISSWFLPLFATEKEQKAANRALDFLFGWFVDPIMLGEYPMSMQELLGDKLPKFTRAEAERVKGSIDFLGVNYYTTLYAQDAPYNQSVFGNYLNDARVGIAVTKAGVLVGTPTALGWLYLVPKGLEYLLLHIKGKYNNPPIYITENGVAEANNASLSVPEAIKDTLRITALDGHLRALQNAIKAGANVKGYYMWAFLDTFEWTTGYTVRFGFVYVDFQKKLKRHLKNSAYWFKKFLLH